LRQVVIMARVLTVDDVLDGHVVLGIECPDCHQRPEICQFRLCSARAWKDTGTDEKP
jgi:hypothetical protein